jgi:hypothetical protein
MRILAVFLLAAAIFAQQQQNLARSRGQVPIPERSQALTYGRIGRQELLPVEPQTFNGVLLDASCEYRGTRNLRQPPQLEPAPLPPQSTGGVSAFGITVDAQTLQRERGTVMENQHTDVRMRQSDPTCAITAGTRLFAVLLPNNQLLNLDQGGNTLATAFLHSDPEGLALLNGKGPSVKPQVEIEGRPQRSTLVVEKIGRPGGATT